MPSQPQTIIDPDLFLYLPTQDRKVGNLSSEGGLISNSLPTVAFFITGNPGLISYYHEFLQLLVSDPPQHSHTDIKHGDRDDSERSQPPSISRSCVVAGFSLGGFDLSPLKQPVAATATTLDHNDRGNLSVDTKELKQQLMYPSGFERKDVYGLRDQTELCYARLWALVDWVGDAYGSSTPSQYASTSLDSVGNSSRTNGSAVKVILLGHSVGAYIALELVRQHSQPPRPPQSPAAAQFTTTAAMLLTPTILDIAHSPSGRLATPLLSTLPFLPTLAQLGARALSSLLPTASLRRLVGGVTGMPAHSAGLAATVTFLGGGSSSSSSWSAGAVRQALYLAREEMVEIGPNRWGREVWGTTSALLDGADAGTDAETGVRTEAVVVAPRLFFWFASGDHWVADATREKILSIVRDSGDGDGHGGKVGAVVVVDEGEEDKLVHAWCIQQSELVADRVRGWIEQVLSG